MEPPSKSPPPRAFERERRIFLKVGVGGAALLLLGRWLPAAPAADAVDAGTRFIYLTTADAAALARIIPVMLEGALPEDRGQQNAAIGEIVRGIDIVIGYQPHNARAEIRDLFGLLTKGVTRALVAGVWRSWENATDKDVRAFLASWRNSRLGLLRSAYIGLNNLIVGSWYGNPKSWERIGYPGPPKIA